MTKQPQRRVEFGTHLTVGPLRLSISPCGPGICNVFVFYGTKAGLGQAYNVPEDIVLELIEDCKGEEVDGEVVHEITETAERYCVVCRGYHPEPVAVAINDRCTHTKYQAAAPALTPPAAQTFLAACEATSGWES